MQDYRVHLTEVSSNAKTGPIPVSTTQSSTCPTTCGQYVTCYAKYGPLGIHWGLVDSGTRGVCWDEFVCAIRELPKGQLWRHNQAGDLPGDGTDVDVLALSQLVESNRGKRGFTYTHYQLSHHNLWAIEAANEQGFAINISCDTLTEADRVRKMTKSPMTVVLHSEEKRKSFMTEGGNRVLVCPAYYQKTNCARCGICADRSEGRAIIGFPAHGAKKKVINLRLMK